MYSSRQKTDIRHALDQVLTSPGFANAPQLRSFLEYVVQKSLKGKTGEIKGYTIGVEALGRSDNFDPQTDPTVRVMAGRLRQALENYNRQAGTEQRVAITIPKGKYAPDFKFHEASETTQRLASDPEANKNDATPPRRLLSRTFFTTFASALLAASLVTIAYILWHTYYPASPSTTPSAEQETLETSELPSITISLQKSNDEIPEWVSLPEAQQGIITAFSRFGEFRIFNKPVNVAVDEIRSDYHFSTLLSRAGSSENIYALTTLLRVSDGAVIWSDNILVPKSDDPNGINVSLAAGQVIAPLLSPYGVIYGDIANRKNVPPRLKCISTIYAYFADESLAGYNRALECAETVAASGTASSSMHALLAFLYVEAFRKQYGDFTEDPLAKADAAARTAVKLDPQNARAHQAWFAAHKTRGNRELAIKAAKKAISLNPFDSDIVGDFASYLVSIGKFSDAEPQLDRALALNPSLPAWLEFYVFLQADLTGDYVRADTIASHINPESSPLAAIAVALSSIRKNQVVRTRKVLQLLVRQEPVFLTNPTQALLRRGFDPDIAETLIARLKSAGL